MTRYIGAKNLLFNPRQEHPFGAATVQNRKSAHGCLAQGPSVSRSDPAPADITWTRVGGWFVADCALTRDGHPVDLAVAEPGR
jgi:hypothetical protein